MLIKKSNYCHYIFKKYVFAILASNVNHWTNIWTNISEQILETERMSQSFKQNCIIPYTKLS